MVFTGAPYISPANQQLLPKPTVQYYPDILWSDSVSWRLRKWRSVAPYKKYGSERSLRCYAIIIINIINEYPKTGQRPLFPSDINITTQQKLNLCHYCTVNSSATNPNCNCPTN